MQNQQQDNDPNLGDGLEIHLWDYVRIVLSRLHIAVTVFLGVLILAMVYTFTRQERFEASSRIHIQRSSVQIVKDQGAMMDDGDISRDREFMPTQLKLLTSEPILRKVIGTVGDEPEFKVLQDPVGAASRMFKVQQVRNSRLIDISVMREKPKQAQKMVNALVLGFQEYHRKLRQGVSDQGLIELEKKKEELRLKLQAHENDIRDFRESHKVHSFEEETRIRMARLTGLNESFYKTEPYRIGLKAKVEAAETALAAEQSIRTLPSVIQSPLIIPMFQTLSNLQIQFEDNKSKLGDNHREVLSLANQIKALEVSMDATAHAVFSSLRSEAEIAQKEAAYLKETIAEQETQVAKLAELKSDYDQLEKMRSVVERNWDAIVVRMEEIDMSSIAGQGESIVVVEEAEVPQNPSWPNKKKNLFLAGLLGGLLGIGACFFMNYMDTSVKGLEDIREIYGCEVLGTLPPIGTESVSNVKDDFLALAKPRSHFAESFRMIRTNLAFASVDKPPHKIAITSALPSEGKSIVSINIAIAQSQLNKKTLLVDADMRKPRLHKAFDVENTFGLADLLVDEKPIDNVMRAALQCKEEGAENLYIIPSGTRPTNPAELLDSEGLPRLIAALEEKFDYIIFDSPPCAQLVDSFIIGKTLDGLIVVVKAFSTQRGASQYLADNLKNSGIKLLGAVCNNKDVPRTGRLAYYYGYGKYGYGGYGYGYGYGYYYSDEPEDKTGMFSRFRGKGKAEDAKT